MRISLRKLDRVAATKEPRKGFVLVEVIVAMVLLAIAVSSLAALMYSVSQSGQVATGDAYRNAVLMHEVNRLEGIPYDSVASGSYIVNTGTYQHTRTVTITEPTVQTLKIVKILIVPTNKKYKADSVTFSRTKAKTSKVLCTTCQ